MASNPQNGTVRTSIHIQNGVFRVRFSCPADGYSGDDLDALRVAIEHAQQLLRQQQLAPPRDVLPLLDPTQAFTEQQSRLAAPS